MEFTHRIATSNRMVSLIPTHEAIRFLKAKGYSAMEFWADTLEAHIAEGATTMGKVKEALKETGMAPVVHATADEDKTLYSISSTDPGWRERSIRGIIRSVEVAAMLGARIMTVHPGRTDTEGEEPSEEHWALQAGSFREIHEAASKHGITVCIEMMERRPREFILEPEDAIRIIGSVSRDMGVTFDITHAYINGWRPDDGRIEKIKPYVRHIHFSGHSREKAHSPLFSSIMEQGYLDAMLRRLLQGYGGMVSIEGSLLPRQRTLEKQKMISERNINYVRENLGSLRKRS